jgi:hypothetical protein
MSTFAARSVPVLLLALALASAPAMAQKVVVDRGGARTTPMQSQPSHHRPHDGRALAAAVRRVERRTGGQVLSAERVPYEGRSLNRIKVVDATGRVRIYMDDPSAARAGPAEPATPEPQRTRGDDN